MILIEWMKCLDMLFKRKLALPHFAPHDFLFISPPQKAPPVLSKFAPANPKKEKGPPNLSGSGPG